jgi:hypothetical protein
MTDRETMQMALDKFDVLDDYDPNRDILIKVLRERLSQPEPEPLCWVYNMNDLIHDLKTINYGTVYGQPVEGMTPLYTEPPKGEWAGLIVRECANHCDLLLDHKMSSEWSRGTHDCSKAIKKHFGVEE